MVDDHHQGLLRRLARWELDLALVYDHASLPEPAVPLERTHLLDDPFDLVVPNRHPLAGRTSAALEELAGETWIGGTPDGAYASIVLHSCRAAGFEPRVVFGSDDYNAVQAFVAVGLGVAMLPRLALTAVGRGGLRARRGAVARCAGDGTGRLAHGRRAPGDAPGSAVPGALRRAVRRRALPGARPGLSLVLGAIARLTP